MRACGVVSFALVVAISAVTTGGCCGFVKPDPKKTLDELVEAEITERVRHRIYEENHLSPTSPDAEPPVPVSVMEVAKERLSPAEIESLKVHLAGDAEALSVVDLGSLDATSQKKLRELALIAKNRGLRGRLTDGKGGKRLLRLTDAEITTEEQQRVQALLADRDRRLYLDGQVLAAAKDEDDGRKSFMGANFGAGFALTADLGGGAPRVESARIVNGVVRVEKSNPATPRLMFEAHYFPQYPVDFLCIVPKDKWSFGPFLGLQFAAQDSIVTYSAGFLFGFRPRDTGGQAFNIGGGIFLDPTTKVLGRGFRDGQPPPPNETEVRYREESRFGGLFMVSFSF